MKIRCWRRGRKYTEIRHTRFITGHTIITLLQALHCEMTKAYTMTGVVNFRGVPLRIYYVFCCVKFPKCRLPHAMASPAPVLYHDHTYTMTYWNMHCDMQGKNTATCGKTMTWSKTLICWKIHIVTWWKSRIVIYIMTCENTHCDMLKDTVTWSMAHRNTTKTQHDEDTKTHFKTR